MNINEIIEAKRKRAKLKAVSPEEVPSTVSNRNRNFVAKHQGTNVASTHPDKKNDYKRRPKHKSRPVDY